MASRRPTPQGLRRILKRQDKSVFGAAYQPAILATVAEAPSVSWAARIFSRKLGRDVHVLSTPERGAAILALYHPALFDLHEQKMLSVGPRPHPLEGHPFAAGMLLLPLRGTLDVAERLGVLKIHPTITWEAADGRGHRLRVPYPYVGDLLLFLFDDAGPYCVNWTIKARKEDFEFPAFNRTVRKPNEAAVRAIARHQIEREYYADAGIRTVKIASKSDFDRHVVANLTQMFGWHARAASSCAAQQADMLEMFQRGLIDGIPPVEVIAHIMRAYRCPREVPQAVLFQAIWHRRLRVDLFRPVLVDRPLRPERRDVLDVYADWFERRLCTSGSS